MSTNNKTVTDIQFAGIAMILPQLGLDYQEQSSFYKIAKDRKAVYVSKTKRKVTRIDISGFVVQHPAVNPPPKKNGAVTGQIDLTHPKAREALELAMKGLVNGKEGFKFVPGSQVASSSTVETPDEA